MARFNLTPEDIKEREKDYLFYTGIFLLLSVSLFCFGFYLLIVDRTFAGCLLGIATSALFASQAFRYHFWYFQIVQRRLGCTFAEWQQFVIGRLPGPKT
jgi:intracellular multiplication protein IcmV